MMITNYIVEIFPIRFMYVENPIKEFTEFNEKSHHSRFSCYLKKIMWVDKKIHDIFVIQYI